MQVRALAEEADSANKQADSANKEADSANKARAGAEEALREIQAQLQVYLTQSVFKVVL